MMKNEKNVYVSPSLELYKTESSDVISTSGFLGDDHIIGGGNKGGDSSGTQYEPNVLAAACSSFFKE